MGTHGMVSSGHPLASQAAVRVLQDGGTAIDAATTAAGVLAVTKPESNGVGGDLFLLSYDAIADKVESLNASGRAPAAASLEAFKDGIPSHGPHSASVPGAVRGWADALERHGTISLADALSPAIDYAENGFPVSVRLATMMAQGAELLRQNKAAARAYLRDGRPYRPGDVLRQPDLARSLRRIAQDGPDVLYKGELASVIAQAHQQDGGYLTVDDLSRQDSVVGEPLFVDYRGCQVYNQPPVSLGAVLLQELKIVEAFDLASLPWDSAERVHLLVEAKKLAFADLESHITDPDFADLPLEGLLSADYAAKRRALIQPDQASDGFGAGDPARYGGSTTYMAVVDPKGNAVSWIQTLFHRFGSGWMAPGTGILLNDRMNGFSTDPNHINRVEGGKRTAHTLNAPMVFQAGKPWLVFGTPGGYGQVQSDLQMLSSFVDAGLDLQAMVEAPRWLHQRGRKLAIESRFPASTLDGLRKLGHDLEVVGPWSDVMGGAQAIKVNQRTGALEGAADPRREGYAIGW
jgi:gamma-glutamyltranspeptidase / glutathione hydrolase